MCFYKSPVVVVMGVLTWPGLGGRIPCVRCHRLHCSPRSAGRLVFDTRAFLFLVVWVVAVLVVVMFCVPVKATFRHEEGGKVGGTAQKSVWFERGKVSVRLQG